MIKSNKRMLSDWFSAALQASRKCGRYKHMRVSIVIAFVGLLSSIGASAAQLDMCGEATTKIARQIIAGVDESDLSSITLNKYQLQYVRYNDFRYPCRVMTGPGYTWNAEVDKTGTQLLLSKASGPEFKLLYYGPFPYAYNK